MSPQDQTKIEMKIEISDKQACVIITALDHYSRIGMGQLETVADALCQLRPKECEDRWSLVETFTDPMKCRIFGYTGGSSAGICSPVVSDLAKMAYDIQCVIRQDIAEREGHDRLSVWHGPPLHTCKSEPLAVVL